MEKYKYFLPRLERVLDTLAYRFSRVADSAFNSERTSGDSPNAGPPSAPIAAGMAEIEHGDAEYEDVLRDVRRLLRLDADVDGAADLDRGPTDGDVTVFERWDDLGVVVIHAACPVHYYALFCLVENADTVVAVYPGNRYEVEHRYTGFVDIQSRDTWPRLSLSALAKMLNARERRLTEGIRWDAPGVTDSGPLLRLNDRENRLTKAQRYGNPSERPIMPSSMQPEEFLGVVRSFFEHGVSSARSAPGVRGKVPRKGWTWKETHDVNAHANWEKFVAQWQSSRKT